MSAADRTARCPECDLPLGVPEGWGEELAAARAGHVGGPVCAHRVLVRGLYGRGLAPLFHGLSVAPGVHRELRETAAPIGLGRWGELPLGPPAPGLVQAWVPLWARLCVLAAAATPTVSAYVSACDLMRAALAEPGMPEAVEALWRSQALRADDGAAVRDLLLAVRP